jgi:sugar phosphate isomerase/epimerase
MSHFSPQWRTAANVVIDCASPPSDTASMPRSSFDLTTDDIVVSHFTLPRSYPLPDRLAAVGDAGAAGIGLYVGDWLRNVGEGMTVDDLGRLLDDSNLCLAELEAFAVATPAGPGRDRMDGFVNTALELADRFGVRYMQAIGPVAEPGAAPLTQVVHEFGALCDRAATVGLTVGLEFLPFTTIATAADAMQVITAVGRPNAGVCVDIWHHRRGPVNIDLATTIPGALVAAIQMNDGTLAPQHDDYKMDCLLNRVAPGDGEMDALEFVRTMIAMGATVPWSIEVCQQESNGGAEHVRRSVAAMRSVLGEARRPID